MDITDDRLIELMSLFDNQAAKLISLFEAHLNSLEFLLAVILGISGLFSGLIVVLASYYVSYMKRTVESAVNNQVKNEIEALVKYNGGFQNIVLDNIQKEVAKAFNKRQTFKSDTKKENKGDSNKEITTNNEEPIV